MAWYTDVAIDDVFYIQITVLSIPNTRFKSCVSIWDMSTAKEKRDWIGNHRNFRIAEII